MADRICVTSCIRVGPNGLRPLLIGSGRQPCLASASGILILVEATAACNMRARVRSGRGPKAKKSEKSGNPCATGDQDLALREGAETPAPVPGLATWLLLATAPS